MNSTLKPVLSQSGVPQAGNQTSPAKANVATANHAVALPQGALNSINHSANHLVGQNLSHQVANTPPVPPHAAPSMAPVSANMAQMAANMSHHGNLSLVTQNAVAVTNNAVSPTKSASSTAPLSLVQDKPNTPPQPLALTRSPEKKEPDSTGQSNGSVESPTPASNEPAPVNPEIQSDKQDIARTSPSTPKPPENSTPVKSENSSTTTQPESPVQPKVATANDSIKPAKPSELKATPAADVAPIADDKPLVESANDNQNADKPAQAESAATPSSTESKKEENIEKPPEPAEEKKEAEEEVKTESSSQDTAPKETAESKPEKPTEVIKTATKAEVKSIAKSTLKLATVTPPLRKRRHLSDKTDGATPPKKTPEIETPSRTKRNRTQVQPYQASALDTSISSPGPSSATKAKDHSAKKSKDKLRLFVSREYVAVRNEENGYYICQLLQHVYRTSGIIRVRWLSQVSSDSTGDVYKPDYCDEIDTGCLMTTLELRRAASGGGLVLRASERARVRSILQRALDAAAAGTTQLDVSEEHPDGLDVTLVTDESQLERKSRKRTSSKASPKTKNEAAAKDSEEESTPAKKSRSRSSKGKTKSPKKGRKSAGSTPVVASTSKTATTVTDTPKNKNKKKGGDKKETPTPAAAKGRRSTRETKSTPVAPEPSTSTGKGTRSAKKK